MTRLLRADVVPATSLVDWWRHVVDETLGPLDLQLPSGPGGMHEWSTAVQLTLTTPRSSAATAVTIVDDALRPAVDYRLPGVAGALAGFG
jgi:hypothetical protein